MNDQYQYKYFQNEKWLKVFSHDFSQEKSFFTKEEALYCVNHPTKYSILSLINKRDRIRFKEYSDYFYEFLYEFTASNHSFYYIKWIQSNNPLNQNEDIEDTLVPGFKNLSSNFHDSKFGGLAKTTMDLSGCIPTFINGQLNDLQWYYAIGMYTPCQTTWDYNYIPGSYLSTAILAKLWIRVPIGLTCYQSKFALKSFLLFITLVYESQQ